MHSPLFQWYINLCHTFMILRQEGARKCEGSSYIVEINALSHSNKNTLSRLISYCHWQWISGWEKNPSFLFKVHSQNLFCFFAFARNLFTGPPFISWFFHICRLSCVLHRLRPMEAAKLSRMTEKSSLCSTKCIAKYQEAFD